MNTKSTRHRSPGLGGFLIMATVLAGTAMADSRDQAKRMHDRIAGVPPSEQTLTNMATAIDANNEVVAALMATDDPEFYRVTPKNLVAPWTNRDQNVFVPLNDYIATVIGMVRDNRDFREILSADTLYIVAGAGIPTYSNTNNAHYEALEDQGQGAARAHG